MVHSYTKECGSGSDLCIDNIICSCFLIDLIPLFYACSSKRTLLVCCVRLYESGNDCLLNGDCSVFNSFLLMVYSFFFRDYHPENVLSSMETIMSLVLEESEDISVELLSPLLTSVKKGDEVNHLFQFMAQALCLFPSVSVNELTAFTV